MPERKGAGYPRFGGGQVDIVERWLVELLDEILAQSTWWSARSTRIPTSTGRRCGALCLTAIENPTQICATLTGRLLLAARSIDYDTERCGKRSQTCVAMECKFPIPTASMEGRYLRMCKERGVKVVIFDGTANNRQLGLYPPRRPMARRGAGEKGRHQYLPAGGVLGRPSCQTGAVRLEARKKKPRQGN